MSGVCTVTTGSRLHFGPLAWLGPLAWKPRAGRDFGGWGVMLETPRCVVRVGQIGDVFPNRTEGTTPVQRRADTILERLGPLASDFRAEVLEAPPEHCGLGSGTQLSLAIARAVCVLTGQPKRSAVELAERVGRGARSAVGIYGFDLGGLIVDAGKRPGDAIGQLAARLNFPDEWRFILIRPPVATGLMGEAESAAFAALPSFPESLTERLSRLLLAEVLPSVQSRDFDGFAAALDEYGERVGIAFAPCQGGVVHRASLPVWNALREAGVRGVAQTSWGPTLAAVCCDNNAESIIELVSRRFADHELRQTRVTNQGATSRPIEQP